jgi:outer membrane translocation and assembly module TamA
MLHGTFDKYTCWQKVESDQDTSEYTTPTTTNPNNNLNSSSTSREPTSAFDDRDSVSQTLVLGASASYNVNKNLSCFVQLDYININNYQNVSGEKTSDMQLVLSLSYSL